jgi:type I restriction enzyme R subunit
MSKRDLTETEICDRYITPAISRAGWDTLQIRREYTFTDGQVIVRGKIATRGERKRADYMLQHDGNIPLAVIEAKDNTKSIGAGMQQALAYAQTLDIPFVFSSNGDGFVFHDRTGLSNPVERQLTLEEFPSPADLWSRYRAWKGITDESTKVVQHPFHDDGSGKEPRYYQRIAIQRTIEAIARGDRRVLLVMATGTGKTYTAFQIIWRLWKAGSVKRVLFLADRNVLVDQTKTNDFKPFGSVMTKVQNRAIDKSFEVYLALYQAISGTEEQDNVYKEFSRDFFDLIVIDECHRGSAKEDSAWREILNYFHPAVHLGLTATPKETSDVSTLTYFGDPIYTYSLKQGIADGFLAPYKVVRVDLDKDLQGWRPPMGMLDDTGKVIEDRIYNIKDMDRHLIVPARTQLVARKICDYLAEVDPYGKTIVFCEDINHAERMRSALVNEIAQRYPDEQDNLHRFVMRITGDNEEGKKAIDDFIHPERRYPVIATTSKLLTTGVDAKTCRLIVLDQTIESMIEFKQIIGRGTRIHEDTRKLWFTIMDFRKATEKFADPDFDGDPIVVFEDPGGPGPPGPDGPEGYFPPDPPPESTPREKYVVGGLEVAVLAERVQYYGPDGRLITESLTDYTRSAIQKNFDSLHDFLNRWTNAEKKQAVVEELSSQGVLFDELQKIVGDGYDPFDLICRVVYDRPALTRRERALQVRKRDVFTKYGEQSRIVLNALLDKYADEGVFPEDMAVLKNIPFTEIGTLKEIIDQFGGKDAYLAAVRELERELYRDAG